MSTPTPKEEEKKPEVAVPEAAAEEKKEEAVAAPKNKNALRRSVERTFRGIGRTLSRSRSRGQSSGNLLPKVFRAKGRKEEKTSSGKKKTKGKKDAKKEVVQRKKAPQLSKTLSSLLSSQEDFALYIGKDLVNTKFSNVDETLLLEVFENELWSTLLDEDAFTSAKVTLAGEEKADVKVKNIELKYKEFLGETAYYNALKTILLKMEEDVDSSSTALVATLIKAVRPKFIIYAGTDSSLQDAFKHDNFPVKACTLNDLQAEGFKAASLTGSLKQKKMLKINGDFSQPETLAFTQEAKFSNFGFDASGKTSENNGKYLKAVLRDVTSTMPVVYVGAALDRNDPLSFVLKELNEGAEKAVTSVALVDEIAKDSTVQRFDSKEIGVEYIIYSPDENKTQLVEFLASMASCVATSAPIVSETNPKIFTKAYVQSAALADAMVALGERELTARAICMFANDLTTCDFVEEPSFKDAVSIPAMFKKGAPDAKDNAKREALEAALTKKVTELHEKLLGSGEEKEEVLLKLLLSAGSMKADITKDTEFNDVIRLKYEALLKLVEASNGKLEVRVVDSTEHSLTSDFTLLFLGEKGFGDVALITEEESEHFALSVYQENTNAAEEKVLLFERLWNVALSKKDSVAAIKQTLELPVEVEAKVEKKRLFSAPFFKKKDKVEKEKEAAPVEEKAKDPAPVEKVEEPKKEEEAKEDKKDEAPKEEEKPKKGMFSNPFARKKDKKEKADKSKKEAVPEPTPEPAAETKDEVKEEIKELKEEKIVETVVAATEEKKADEDKKAAEEEAPKENEKENKKAAAKKADKAKADKKAKTLKKDKDKKKTDKKDTKKKTDKKDAKVEKKDKKKTDKKEAKAEAKVEKTEEKVEAKEAAPELEAKIEDLEKQEEEGAPVEEKTDKKLTKKEKTALAKKEKADKAAASKKKDKKEKPKKETKKEETKIEIVDDVKEKAAELTAQVDKKEEAKVEKAAEEIAEVKEDKKEAEAEPKADVEEKKEEAPKSPGVMSKFASKMKSTLPRGKKDKKKPAEKKEESAAAEEKPAEVATEGKKEEAVKA